MATELRLRTVIELTAFFDSYMKEYKDDDFEGLCGVTYEEDVYECATDGGYVSIWVMAGLASVIQGPIVSVYPTINGINDPVAEILNRTLLPRLNYDANCQAIHIMWTRADFHVSQTTTWVTNHFVPLVLVPVSL